MKQYILEIAEEERTTKMQQRQQVEEGDQERRKRFKLTSLKSHSLRGCRRLS